MNELSSITGSNENDLVSFCIATYNSQKYIRETLTSICNQTYTNFEVIVVNDGSTDDTAAEIEEVDDKRIKQINIVNGGAAKARNLAYGHSKGRYVVFFDADDYIKPDFLQQQMTALNERDDVVAMAAWGRFYNDDLSTFALVASPAGGEITFVDWINLYWHNCNPMTNPGRAIIPRKIINEAGLWNESLSLNDDLEFFTRIFIKAQTIVLNNNSVFYYRSGIGGLSGFKSDEAYQSLYNSILYSVKQVLDNYTPNAQLWESCANMWQSFIYTVYPKQKLLIKAAATQIDALAVKPTHQFPASGATKLLSGIIGWRLTQQLKYLSGQIH